jgi:O-antigen ligase
MEDSSRRSGNNSHRRRTAIYAFCFLLCLYAAAFLFFYLKYVPLIKSFQSAMLPILAIVFISTSFKPIWGTLSFIFAFPLINSLPYFFGIFADIPHAPTALLLFLAYFMGWLGNRTFAKEEMAAGLFRLPVRRPLVFLSCLIILSGLVTSWRYANFYPVRSDANYDLAVNVNGVTAGGAQMSTLFNGLAYLTGFLFFVILLDTLKTGGAIRKSLAALWLGAPIMLFLSYYQYLINPGFGNTPFWVKLGQINASFKDPNAFGAFLASTIPLLLGMIVISKGMKRVIHILILAAFIFVFPQIGARSPLLAIVISLLFFSVIWARWQFFEGKKQRKAHGKAVIVGILLSAILILGYTGFLSFSNSRLAKRLNVAAKVISLQEDPLNIFTARYFLWKEAARMVKDYPLSGVGLGAFIIELPNYYQNNKDMSRLDVQRYRRIDSAENYFLQLAAELGLIGLAICIWLFWVIFEQLRNSLRADDEPDKVNKYIRLGASAGIVSLMVNFLFHSYIGSFEIQYIFWFLVALIYHSGGEDERKEKIRLKKPLPAWPVP